MIFLDNKIIVWERLKRNRYYLVVELLILIKIQLNRIHLNRIQLVRSSYKKESWQIVFLDNKIIVWPIGISDPS